MFGACGHGGSIGRRFRRAFVFPGDDENERDAGADGGISDVEGGKIERFVTAAALEVEMEEVHHRMAMGIQAVGEVADDAAEDQAKGDLPQDAVRAEMPAREKQGDQGDQGHDRQHRVIAGEHAPGGARIDAIREIEKAGDDDAFIALHDGGIEDQPFGQLIKRQNSERQSKDTAIGLLKNETGGGHDKFMDTH